MAAMSTDGDDPKDKKPQPPSTLAGVVPQPPRHGLPPPRSTHGRSGGTQPPPFVPSGATPRAGSQSQPPFSPGGQPRPFSQPQGQPTPPPSQPGPTPQSGAHPHPGPTPQSGAHPHPGPTPQSGAHPQPHSGPHPHPQAPRESQANTAPHTYPFQQSQPNHASPPQATQQPPSGPSTFQPQHPGSFAPPQPPGSFAPPQPPPQGVSFPTPPHLKDPEWAQAFPTQTPGQEPLPTATARPRPGVPESELLQSESSPIEQFAEAAAEVPGRFMAFLKLSAKRAFRIRIEPDEVLPDERAKLAAENPPIVDPNLQAFLAWRRSVLFLVATFLTILSIMGLVESLGGYKVASSVRFVKLFPTLAECAFCIICWLQLRNWTNWRKQRKWLLLGWLLFMLTPFLVFMYPLKLAVMDASRALTIEQMRELGYSGVYNRVVAPFAFSFIALFQLAPKVISLMPGLIRSSMVIKLLFPGASAPGWLIVMCAPIYGLIAYALLIIPYQFTASGWFIFGVLLLMIGQVLIMRSGFALARPLSQEEALYHIKRVRKFYLILLITAAVSILVGLGILVDLLHMRWTTVVTTVLKFETNVMILTTIGTDLVVTNLDRARGYTEGKEHIEDETEIKIAAFVGLNAPPTPPPPGPAHH